MNDNQIPLFKLLSVWVAAMFGSWSEFAGFLAAIYSIFLLVEWVTKKTILAYKWWQNKKNCSVHMDDEDAKTK